MPRYPANLYLWGAVAALALAAAPVAAGQVEWNQAEVSALTQQLLQHVSKIKKGIRRDWDREDKQSARYVVLDDAMTLHHRVVALDGLVRAGQGRERTAPVSTYSQK